MPGRPRRSRGTSSAAAVPLVQATATGPTGRLRDPERDEPARPLVEKDVQPDTRVRARARARAASIEIRATATRDDAARDELVDEAPTRRPGSAPRRSHRRRRGSSPSAMSRPQAACVSAVPVRTGISSRPVAVRTRVERSQRERPRGEAEQPPLDQARRSHRPGRRPRRRRSSGTRRSRASRTAPALRGSPSRTASVCLPAAASVAMSRRLFATRIATASRPSTAPHHHASAVHRLDHHERRAARGHQAEEHEHHQLAEARAPRTDAGRRCTGTPRRSRAAPITRMSTGAVAIASARPAKPAAAIAISRRGRAPRAVTRRRSR